MVMHEMINAIPPRLSPTMRSEYLFENGSGIVSSVKTDRLAIIQQRQFLIVWNVAIVTKLYF